jgi:PAS domain S-box-containing protein
MGNPTDFEQNLQPRFKERGDAPRLALTLATPSITVWEQDEELHYRWVFNAERPDMAIIGKRDIDIMPSREDAERVQALKQRVLDTGVGLYEQISVLYHDGLVHTYDLVVQPIRAEDGRITGIRCAAADITAYKEAEAALERSARIARLQHEAASYLGETLDPEQVYDRFHELLAAVVPHDGLLVSSYDPERQLIRCDYAWTDGQNLNPASLPALPLNPHGEGMQSRVIRSGESLLVNDVIERVQHEQGTLYNVDGEGNVRKVPEMGLPEVRAAIMTPLKFQGQVLGVVQVMSDRTTYTQEQLQVVEAVVAQMSAAARNARLYQAAQHEIVERHKIEQSLRASEQRFRAFANTIPAIAWTAAPDGTVTYANDQWFIYCGLTPEENATSWPELVLHPDDYERCMTQWTQALREGLNYQIEVRNRRYDGEYRWFLTQAVPERDAEGNITVWYGTTTDIHDRKQTERNLQFLFDLGTRMRAIEDPQQLLRLVVQMLADYMDLSRAYFGEIDPIAGQLVINSEHYQDLPSLAGLYHFSSFNPQLLEMLLDGQTIVSDDTQTDPLTAAQYESYYRPMGIVSRIGVPLFRDGVLAGTLWGSRTRPHVWSQQEISLLETAAARIWLAFERARLNSALRASEERFQLASRAVVGFIYDWNVETGENYRSEGVERVTGVSLSQVTPVFNWWRKRVHPDDMPLVDEQVEAALQGGADSYELEYRFWHEDGYWLTLWDRGNIVRDATGKAVRVVGNSTDISQRKRAEVEREQLLAALDYEQAQLKRLNENLEQQVQVRTAQVRQLAAALTLSEQQERRQLARELHDSAGQLLTALQIYIRLIQQEIPEELDGLREKMAEAVKMIQETQQEVRAVSHAMRPAALDQLGLRAALEELCHEFARRTGLEITYQGEELPPLDEHVTLNFYRFLQEALTNAAKHSQARTIQVFLGCLDGELVLTIEDDGVGFNVQEALASAASETGMGMGLQGLQERFFLFGGRMEIDSRPGRGTRLIARHVLKG